MRGSSRVSDPNVAHLREIFSGYPIIEYKPESSNGLMAAFETLTRTEQEWPDLPVLVILDSSVTSLTSESITNLMKASLNTKVDMIFLTHWLDNCASYTSVEGWPFFETSLMRSTSPSSGQAILYTPRARQLMITNLSVTTTTITDYGLFCNYILAAKKLSGAVFVPDLVTPDINLITSNANFYKYNGCLLSPPAGSGNRTQSFIIYIVIFVIVIIAAWCLLRMAPK